MNFALSQVGHGSKTVKNNTDGVHPANYKSDSSETIFSMDFLQLPVLTVPAAPLKKGAVILCGGQSSRMGRDKATLPFGPELMLQRVIRIIAGVVESTAIVIVAAPDQILPDLPKNVIVTRDEHPGRGPLEGLAGGLRAPTRRNARSPESWA